MKKKLLTLLFALVMVVMVLAINANAAHFDKTVTSISGTCYGYNNDGNSRYVPIVRDVVVTTNKTNVDAQWTVSPFYTNQKCDIYKEGNPARGNVLYFYMTGPRSSLVDYGKVTKDKCTLKMEGATVECVELIHEYTDTLPYSQLKIVFKVTLEKTALPSGTITGFTTPVAGEYPDTEIKLSGNFLTKTSYTISWQKFNTAKNKFEDVSSTERFKNGEGAYRAKIVITPNDKYYFNDGGNNLEIKLGSTVAVYDVNDAVPMRMHIGEYSSSRIVLYTDGYSADYTTSFHEFTAKANGIVKRSGKYYVDWTTYNMSLIGGTEESASMSYTDSELFTNSTLTTRLTTEPAIGQTYYFKWVVKGDVTVGHGDVVVNDGAVKINGYFVKLVKNTVITVNGDEPATELVFSVSKQRTLGDISIVFNGITASQYLEKESVTAKATDGTALTPEIVGLRLYNDRYCNGGVTSDYPLKSGKTYYSYANFTFGDSVDVSAFVNNPKISFTYNGYKIECLEVSQVGKDVRVYLSVVKHCDIRFSTNAFRASGSMDGVTVETGSTFTIPVPTFTPNPGYVFDAWSANTVSGQLKPGDTITVTGDITLTAHYKEVTYTVSFASNGGSGTMSPVTTGYGYYTLPECTFTAPAGKEFKCWSVGGTEYNKGTSIAINADATVSAVWQNVTYTVSFDANGGRGTMADVTGVSEEFTLPACTFTAPDGKRFKEWKVGSKTYQAGESIEVDKNVLIVAVWEEIPAGHTCTVEKVEKVDATCTESGKKAYYVCTGCGKAYENSAATRLIDDLSEYGIIDALGHNPSDWQHDEFGHFKGCKRKNCNEIIEASQEAHIDANEDGECDVCEYTLTIDTPPVTTEPEDETDPTDTTEQGGATVTEPSNSTDDEAVTPPVTTEEEGSQGGGNNSGLVIALVAVVVLCLGMSVVIVILLKKKKA